MLPVSVSTLAATNVGHHVFYSFIIMYIKYILMLIKSVCLIYNV